MARILFSLLSALCAVQVLAAPINRRTATLNQRAVFSNPGCNNLSFQFGGIDTALFFLGEINPSDQVDDPEPLLNAQLSLVNASRVFSQVALALLKGEPPAANNSETLILSGLNDAQKALSSVSIQVGKNGTQELEQANSFVASAIVAAQRAVDLNCTTVADGSTLASVGGAAASPSVPDSGFYSMVSIPEGTFPTTGIPGAATSIPETALASVVVPTATLVPNGGSYPMVSGIPPTATTGIPGAATSIPEV
ncbi:hypothetical protein C8R44DRAFT_742083 [Mycena epipterygia]|nr:hypothetical protein C8R44DRAFT_742083 [Mycena epipterygia]